MALQTQPSEPAELLPAGQRSTGYHRAVGRRRLRVLLAGCVGALLGIGAYTFRYAEGLSYFSTEPSACANCHIMQSQYQSWGRASHHTVAVCVDCHLPHAGLRKLLAKAENGYRHSKGNLPLRPSPSRSLFRPRAKPSSKRTVDAATRADRCAG